MIRIVSREVVVLEDVDGGHVARKFELRSDGATID